MNIAQLPSYSLYYETWLTYLALGALVFMLAWNLVKRWHALIKIPLLSLVGAMMFTPWYAIQGKIFLAPAMITLIFDAMEHDIEQAGRGLGPMAIAWILFMMIGTLSHHIHKKWHKPKASVRRVNPTF